jgi:dTDP-4-amino-4,6-dideoxy-D-galactose acyltransferase
MNAADGNGVCQFLPWDSEFFHLRIARMDGAMGARRAADALAWCSRHSIECLYLLAPSDDAATVAVAEDNGFRFVDIRHTFDLDLFGMAESPPTQGIRSCEAQDVDALARLARTSHTDSRFFADPKFERTRCEDLYEAWLRRSAAGWAQEVFVASDSQGPAGYCSAHRDDKSTGSIGLIAIHPRAQGAGWGPRLVSVTLAWFKREGLTTARVVTQGRNIPAQRLYQRLGFRTRSVELWYHKWFR